MNYQALSTFRAGQASDSSCLTAINAVVTTGILTMPISGTRGILYYMLNTASTVSGHLANIYADVQAMAAGASSSKQIWASQLIAYMQANAAVGLNLANSVDGNLFAGLGTYGIMNANDIAAAELAMGYTAYQYQVSGIFAPGETPRAIVQADLTQAALVAQWQALSAFVFGLLTNTIGPGLQNAQAGQANGPVPTAASLTVGH